MSLFPRLNRATVGGGGQIDANRARRKTWGVARPWTDPLGRVDKHNGQVLAADIPNDQILNPMNSIWREYMVVLARAELHSLSLRGYLVLWLAKQQQTRPPISLMTVSSSVDNKSTAGNYQPAGRGSWCPVLIGCVCTTLSLYRKDPNPLTRKKMAVSSAMALKSHRKLLELAIERKWPQIPEERWLCEDSCKEQRAPTWSMQMSECAIWF
jgi:hypothetical protein